MFCLLKSKLSRFDMQQRTVNHIYPIYSRHSEDLIKKLEQAGLGYHVAAEATTDTFGK